MKPRVCEMTRDYGGYDCHDRFLPKKWYQRLCPRCIRHLLKHGTVKRAS